MMRGFYNKLQKIKEENFESGKRFSTWKGIYESFETFLFVLPTSTIKGSHVRDPRDLKRTMWVVILALIPSLIMGTFNIGHMHFLAGGADVSIIDRFIYGLQKILPLLVVSYGVGLAIEFVFVYYKGEEINEGYLVTGILIPLIVPPDIPLWMLAIAIMFAVIIGKEAFGGTGMNVFNPALLARAFLFFAYPANMSGSQVWVSGTHFIDGFSGATPLANAAASTAPYNVLDHYSMVELLLGNMPGSIGETSKLAILIGALVLLYSGIGSARIMISVFAGGLLMGGIFNLAAANPYMQMPAWQHFMVGGFLFGTVFMATDPVSASQTKSGKVIYGILIGMLAVFIRVLNPAYPEGMMLAILFMNAMAPLIDYYVIRGHIRQRKKRMLRIKSITQ